MPPTKEVYQLPPLAYKTLSDPTIKLELHLMSFSHYCVKVRWALRLLGLPYKEVIMLPLAHMPAMLRLQRRFKQGPGPKTASSQSPAATPVLALYTQDDKPLCLLQNSALIMRYAALRAKALNMPVSYHLYGESLTVDTSCEPPVITGSGEEYQKIADLELRLSGTMGIEVRRVVYWYFLPRPRLAGRLFKYNSTGLLQWCALPLYYLSRFMLPKLLKINEFTAARAQQRLLAEFDFFDQILLQQQQQQKEAPTSSPTTEEDSSVQSKLPFYLCGSTLTAADVSLATLGGYVVGASYQQNWHPEVEELPEELQKLIKELRSRPTGKFILDIWRVHGPPPAAAAAQAAGTTPTAASKL